jgi:hypothetical protein
VRHCRARLEIDTSYPAEIVEALQPDNIRAPPYMRVSCAKHGGKVECNIEVYGCEDPKRILTLRNTIDEILVLARTIEETLRGVERHL